MKLCPLFIAKDWLYRKSRSLDCFVLKATQNSNCFMYKLWALNAQFCVHDFIFQSRMISSFMRKILIQIVLNAQFCVPAAIVGQTILMISSFNRRWFHLSCIQFCVRAAILVPTLLLLIALECTILCMGCSLWLQMSCRKSQPIHTTNNI